MASQQRSGWPLSALADFIDYLSLTNSLTADFADYTENKEA